MSRGSELKKHNSKAQNFKGNILFVHGAWHGEWCWEKYFIDIFTNQGYDCYTFNLSLHNKPGKNSRINRLTLKNYVNDLSTVLNQFADEPIVMAHSMGGLVVQKYLEKFKLKKVVLLASVPHTGVFKVTLKLIFRTKYALVNILKFHLFGLVNSKQKAKWTLYSDGISDELVEYTTRKLSDESILVFIQMMLPLIKNKHHTQSSMLVLAGTNDNLFKVKELEKTAKKYDADFKIIEGVAHNMMLDCKYKEVANEITGWLNK